MYDLVLAALEAQQLTQAATLIKQWQGKNPQDPWLRLAMGRYWEAKGDLEKAQVTYTRVLQTTANPKALGQAREGVQRMRDQLAQQREHDLNAAKNRPGATQTAILALAPVAGAQRQAAAQGLAQVLQLDLYTARMRLPSQHWRLLRVGPAGELQYFCEQLQAQQIPARWTTVEQIKALPVFRVEAIQAFEPHISLICQDHTGQRGSLQLGWADISRWLVGALPLYESVVDLGPWGKLKRKQATQDYAEVMDWHLHRRGCILRFCDRAYNYRDTAAIPAMTDASPQTTLIATTVWKALKAHCQDSIQAAPYTDFTGFGAGALDLMTVMPPFEPYIDLIRPQPSAWDGAFHLYSSLRFLCDRQPSGLPSQT
ncbi:MAG: hypothetical protein EA342_02640 [Leptolyngbya sp. LCM1.Bin17]|nr:MAG: hypothetical protein EA342_02640 [Leptolyngbya sp. LCM1.Bin17]